MGSSPTGDAVGMRTDSPQRRNAGASASLTVNLLRTFNEVALREVKWAEQNVGSNQLNNLPYCSDCSAVIFGAFLTLSLGLWTSHV